MSLVSILMPFKDEQKYLKECLDSIVSQDDVMWELIAIDDHSTDQSFQIVEAYQKVDSRIRVIRNQGIGVIAALQAGFALANGNFITRMDADDKMTSTRISTMRKQLKQHGQGHLAIGLVHYFSDSQLMDGYKNYEVWLNGLSQRGDNFKEIYKECVIPSPCWMVHREDFERSGGFSAEIYPEDYDLCFRFYAQELKVIPASQVLLHWRDYATRSSRTSELYKDHSFIPLKMQHFISLDYDKARDLYVWGAGDKGKRIAKQLNKAGIKYKWVCNNDKKIGQEIYGQILQSDAHIPFDTFPQLIIAIANKEVQKEIKDSLITNGLKAGRDYFFFC